MNVQLRDLIGDPENPNQSWPVLPEELIGWDRIETAVEKRKDIVLSMSDNFSKPRPPNEWARIFGCSWATLKKQLDNGSIRVKKLTTKSYCVHLDDLPDGYQE